MRITGLALMIAAAAGSAWAGVRPAESWQLTVCMESVTNNTEIQNQAQTVASRIFAGIGVKIRWRGSRNCPREAIYVSVSSDKPASDHPGALAYAMPYGGRNIVVFLDRVVSLDRKDMPSSLGGRLLGYALAHEMTHILQGQVRHSETGVMKAQWDAEDHHQIMLGRLGFAAEDVDLIYQGLDRRRSR